MGTVTELREKTTSMGELLKPPAVSRGFILLMLCMAAWGVIAAILVRVLLS